MHRTHISSLIFSKSTIKRNGDLLLVYFLLCMSGNPAIGNIFNIDLLYSSVAVLLAIWMLFYKDHLFNRKFIFVSCSFLIIFLVQTIIFSFFPYITIAGFYIRLFVGFAVIRIIKNFPQLYIRTMFYLAIVSLFFNIPDQLAQYSGFDYRSIFIPLKELIGERALERNVLFFHTFMNYLPYRNAGMFWEPGAFAGYIILALGLLGLIREELPKRIYQYYLIILLITLFTTKSSTGYLALPFALLTHFNLQTETYKKKLWSILRIWYFALPLLIIVSITSYQNIDFLEYKIKQSIENVKYQEKSWHRSRIGSFIFDLEYIKKRPLTGWGLHPKTRYALTPWVTENEGMGNGMSDFTAKFGMIGMLVFLVSYFKGMYQMTNQNTLKSSLMVVLIILVLQGENFLGYPLFMGLMFLCDRPGWHQRNNTALPPRQVRIRW